jgi:catechol 2,3-dioxygenase-like lactoylglutathione lyase family enzyme
MKTFHVHLKVKDLNESIAFYNQLFNCPPSLKKPDYAKWMLDDPKINFAISLSHGETGIEHLGLQAEDETGLKHLYDRLQKAKGTIREEGACTCCYARSQKSWISDPQGVEWEVFYTYGNATIYGEGQNARPAAEIME